MKDLFDREQAVLDQAKRYLETVKDQLNCEQKPFAELVREYERILKLMRRVTRVSDKTTVELNAHKMKLLDEVKYDALTGIYNRRFFEDELQNIVKSCVENGQALGILMLDVDFFKRFNDTYGHGLGDECLQKIAAALSKSIPEQAGFAARYGGEEFVAVLPGARQSQVQKVANAVLSGIRALKIPHCNNGAHGFVTVSIGGTSIGVVCEMKKAAYLRCADAALYRSKQTERACFTFWEFKEEENDC